MDIHKVRIQTAAPRGTFPGAVEFANYTIDGNTVMLVTEHGAPIDRHKFSRRLKSGEDAHAVAAVMLRQWKKPKSGGFNRALRYPKIGY
jgi:hypothetical protein